MSAVAGRESRPRNVNIDPRHHTTSAHQRLGVFPVMSVSRTATYRAIIPHTISACIFAATSQNYDYSPSALPPTNHSVRRPDYNRKLVVVGDGGSSGAVLPQHRCHTPLTTLVSLTHRLRKDVSSHRVCRKSIPNSKPIGLAQLPFPNSGTSHPGLRPHSIRKLGNNGAIAS